MLQHPHHACRDERAEEEGRRGPWKVRLEVEFPLILLTTSPGRRPGHVLAFWMKPMTAGEPELVRREGRKKREKGRRPGVSEGRRVMPSVGEVYKREVSRTLSTNPRKALTEVSSTA
jgi:hypothetical protein